MDRCINISHPEFKELVRQSNINPLILKSKVGVWQEKNNTDKFPTLEQLGVRANINVGRINSKQDIEGFKEFDDKSKIKGIGRVSVKNGVAELFESNPELANAVYEALGFDKILEFYKDDNLKIDGKTYTISEKISSKELAKRNGLTISSNVPVYIVNEPLGLRKGG